MQDLLRHPPGDVRLKQHMTAYEKQISQDAFQEAADTNKVMLEILNAREPETTHSTATLIKQTRAAQILLDQIIADQSQKRILSEQIIKDKKQLNQKEQSIETLKTLIKSLNQNIQTLENQTSQLEKQIKRMKQIDLK